MNRTGYDAVIVGAGPNGLTAGAILGAAGLAVLILEGHATVGGGCRTEALTLPGFLHDVCGAIHPMGVASPIFEKLGLTRLGVEWVAAPRPLAHPLDDGRVALLYRDLPVTAEALGPDGRQWAALVGPFVARHRDFFHAIFEPLRRPRHPLLMARFGLLGLQSCARLARRFETSRARALLAGIAAHSMLPLEAAASASFGIVLAVAGHTVGWPCARWGSQRIVDGLVTAARAVGCEIQTGTMIRSLADLPPARAVLFNLTPRQLDAVAGQALSPAYRRALRRYRYGPGVFKIDYALSEPIPWRSSECAQAATVHVGGTYEEIARSAAETHAGRIANAPFVLVAQQSRFDATRAPAGRHTGWVYCHVPNGADVDQTERIERQIERFAPGFRDTILARQAMPPAAIEAHNPNMIGGDIGGGSNALAQLLLRPTLRWNPYTTSNPKLFLCSSSTPPGGGVHGLCGYYAAETVLRTVFRRSVPAALRI